MKSIANIKFRISIVEKNLLKLKTELKESASNPIKQIRVIEKIRKTEGELIGLNFALK